LLDSASVGIGFDSATFEVLSGGNVLESVSFSDVGSANKFFSHDLMMFALGLALPPAPPLLAGKLLASPTPLVAVAVLLESVLGPATAIASPPGPPSLPKLPSVPGMPVTLTVAA
jgi:hypothetical protein